jgi:hypothetical protein
LISPRRAALSAIAALLVAAACSGSGSRLSKQSYIDRAGQICAAANTKIRRLPHPDLTDPQATTDTIRRLLAIQHAELDDLRSLEPPAIDEPTAKKWLGLVNKALDEAAAALAALERSDRNGVNQANTRGSQAQLQADDLARGYGINRCVASQQTPPTTTTGPPTSTSAATSSAGGRPTSATRP